MSDPAIPPEISAKYELRGTLGRGASGVVLDAFDRLIQRRVAIKLVQLPPGGEAEAAETHQRFRREAQAAGRLSHPGIVAVYDYGENDGQAWIVMERVGGGTLKALLDSGVRLPVAEAARIITQVLEALAYSHARGVVHRDIKPANIMLDDAEDAAAPRVKITDFGISRLEDSAITRLGTVLGTPSSMAPEQLRGEPADQRADIWAAGTVLYQLLTGEKAFSGGFQAVMHKVLHTEPVAPSLLSDSLPRGFDAVIARALAKRPEERFQSAADFARAVAEAARETPPPAFAGAGPLPGLEEDATLVGAAPARPGPHAPGPAPATAKRRVPAWLPALALLALVGGGAGAWWLWPRGPVGDPAAGRTDMAQSGASGTGQAGNGQPGPDQSGTGQPPAGQTDTGQGGTPRPDRPEEAGGQAAQGGTPPAGGAAPEAGGPAPQGARGDATPPQAQGGPQPQPGDRPAPQPERAPQPSDASPPATAEGGRPATPPPPDRPADPPASAPGEGRRENPDVAARDPQGGASPAPQRPADPPATRPDTPPPGGEARPQPPAPQTPADGTARPPKKPPAEPGETQRPEDTQRPRPGSEPPAAAQPPTPETRPPEAAPAPRPPAPPPAPPTTPGAPPQQAAPAQPETPPPSLPPGGWMPEGRPGLSPEPGPGQAAPAAPGGGAPQGRPQPGPSLPGFAVPDLAPSPDALPPGRPGGEPSAAPAAPSGAAGIAAAMRQALAASSCALVSGSAGDQGGVLGGAVRRGESASLAASLQRAGLPAGAVRLELQEFTGPYCPLAPVLAPFLAPPGAAPVLRRDGGTPLLQGDLLRLDIVMPQAPSYLELIYLTTDGQVVQLQPPEAQAAGARLRKGDPGPGFPGWVVEEPFGTDLLLVITSDRPVFPAGRPVVQPIAEFTALAQQSLQRLRQEGGRAEIRPLVVTVAPRR